MNVGHTDLGVVELRRYTLHPGRRDELIELFEREFVEPQEAAGMIVLGAFRDVDHPDTFTWLRAFADMSARRRALERFYGGPVWAAHRDAANATMIDSDDVHLLEPEPTSASEELDASTTVRRFAVITTPGRRADVPAAPGWIEVASFSTLAAVNDFPALPVHTDRVGISVWAAADASAAWPDVPGASGASVVRLEPTARSRWR